ncbi:MAG: c-type cytochrome [Planctomycetes bacterium]|nr:c-type cytochrome [Planctomycetota bacterium]MCP4769987.1 c-type cytochrome [Planctomycetota bacterium]MCP4859827.1 c-type cytochrome [Planctomycetota bacterium]
MGPAALPLALALLAPLVGTASTAPLNPQNGDKAGEEQVENWQQWKLPSNAPLSAAEELATFKVPEGFRVELVAAEPLVREPVAMQWDEHGRLWVVEMSSFMEDVLGTGEDAPDGFIVVLEDTDGDGVLDKRNEFASELLLPRALSVVKGGALVMSPPHILYCEDLDGDLIADRQTVVASGFEVGLSSPEHAPNGLMWGLDNWMYNAKDGTRYRFLNGKLEKSKTSFNGQWGITQDDFGRIYYNTNSYPLYGNMLPAEYLQRNPHLKSKKGIAVGLRDTNEVWPSRPTPGVNRGYRSSTLRDDGTLSHWTGACGPHIYRSSWLGEEFRNNAFVCEPCANFVRYTELNESDGWLTGVNPAPGDEFFTSTDERFRPVNICDGPDGGIYVADMYRGLLQHRLFLTTYLRKQIEERELDGPESLGRIWRIVPDTAPAAHSATDDSLGKATQLELVAALSHNDGWWRQTAQRLLVENELESQTARALQVLAQESNNPLARMHALHTLETKGEAFGPTLMSALQAEDPKLLAHAIRLSEAHADYVNTIWQRWLELAESDSMIVRRQLCLSLGQLERPAALELLGTMLRSNANDRLIPSAVLSGVKDREVALLKATAAAKTDWPNSESMVKTYTLIAECVARSNNDQAVSAAAEFAGKQPAIARDAILVGLGKGSGKKLPTAAEMDSLPQAHQDSIERGATVYRNLCSACHAADGAGAPGLAPPLAGSDWLGRDPSELSAIVLDGLNGPIKVSGQDYNLDMPPLATLSDNQISDVLNWVRWQWSETTTYIDPKVVTETRKP